MTNTRTLRRVVPGFLLFALLAGAASWTLPSTVAARPAKPEVPPGCIWVEWEGHWFRWLEECSDPGPTNCSYVGIVCPPAM